MRYWISFRYSRTSIKTNLLTYIKELKPRRQITVNHATKTNRNVRPKTLIIGGATGISLAVSLNFIRNGVVVRCHSDRISGFRSKVTKPDEGKFDWSMFWRYLKPHLLKFIGAIAVRMDLSIMSVLWVHNFVNFHTNRLLWLLPFLISKYPNC